MQGGELPLFLQGDQRKPVRIRDISRAGVAFYSEEPLAVMSRMRFAIEFPRPGEPPLLATGEGVVVRCERIAAALDHYEVAIFFNELQPEARSIVSAWVDHRLAQARPS